MGPPPERVAADAPAAAVARAIAREPSGIVAVERDGVVVGGVTRAALRRALGEPEASGPAPREAGLDLAEALRALPGLMTVFGAIEVVAKVVPGVYLVGGAVRDLLLGARSIDVDVAVEGDAVAFARALARALHGRATVHERFATASIRHPGGRIDVTTARTELYDAPGALPAVRRATIEDDLHRRDFTINAMAVSLRTADFGRLVDPFGGRRDLERGLVRVLHGLSFVDDPTRLFRAARYASRLRFGVEGHTLGLARACVRMGLVGRLSGHRVADELALLLGERDGLEGVGLLDELGVLAALHPGITGDAETRSLASRIDDLRAEHTPELPVWRPRLAVLCRHLAPDDLSAWLSSIELRRRDAARIADACAAARVLPDALGAARTPAEAFRVASAHDPDGVLLALATCPPGRAHDWLVRYLRELRHVRPAITGADLAALGLPESPRVGDVLRELHRRKLNGELATRDDELDAARTLVAELLRDGP
jgi:tRNA nucleotidyltransferase (CCA-adding enzyme)